MKTLRKLSFAMIIALAFASCGSNKQVANPTPQQQQAVQQPTQQPTQKPTQGPPERQVVEMPCKKEARSTPEYYRELGIGTHPNNEQSARDQALKSAKEMLKTRLGGVVKGISTDYSRNISGDAPADKVERLMEQEMIQVVDKMLNDADNPCEELLWEEPGCYKSYYVIEVSKKELIQNSIETLSKDQEIAPYFHRDNFRKWAEEYMKNNN